MQLPCWIPVFIGMGILLGFSFQAINYWVLIAMFSILSSVVFLTSNLALRALIISLCCIIIGLLALQARIYFIDSPIIPFDNEFARFKGRIDNIIPLDHGYRILLSDIKVKKLNKNHTPHKIRLTVKTQLNDAKIGDYVKLSAILNKPMQPYLPNGYNFARDAYFKQIGAVGYSVSNLNILETNDLTWRINALRNRIQARVNQSIGSYTGSIATALMLNEYSNLDKQILADLRSTGLAHILSVSGMHLSLVAAIFFFSSRFLLNLFEPLALKIHCKKIAAAISLLGSLGYLLISGMEVAAIRSFIMTSMIIMAIIIDRTSTPMRAIALAASIILLISPENIIHPSFQMSFAAVLALIACFELFGKIKFDFADFNFIQKGLFYLTSLSFASLVAGLATMPFALYHFSQSSNYSILANLLAVPITSFLLMPCVVLTFILYPLHLEFLSLYPMKLGIELMIKIAHYIANLPHSVTLFAKITDANLLIIVFGMLWFCIWNSKIRIAGIAIIIFAAILQSFTPKADIFIDWKNKNIAVLDKYNRLVFLTKPLAKFKKKLLMNHLGTSISLRYPAGKSKDLTCNDICLFQKNNYQVKIDLKTPQIEINKNIIMQSDKSTSLIYLSDGVKILSTD